MPESGKQKLLIAGYEASSWKRPGEKLLLCDKCYGEKALELRADFHTFPLFFTELLPNDSCSLCKKSLLQEDK